MQLRRAEAADAGAIAELHVSSWRAAYSGLLPDELLDGLSVAERRRNWEGYLTDDANPVATVVAVESGTVVGFSAVEGSELVALYVEPARWGTGVGAALMSQALEGRDEMVLWVLAGNERARSFYGHFGFGRL